MRNGSSLLVWSFVFGAFALPSCSRSHGETPTASTIKPPSESVIFDAGAEAQAIEHCEESPGVVLFASPASPWKGAPLRVIALSEKPLTGELRLESGGNEGDAPAIQAVRHGGPPYFWAAEVAAPRPGTWTATFRQTACERGRAETALRVTVDKKSAATRDAPKRGLWPARTAWSRDYENLYSAWIELLFDAPDSEQPSWTALHEVLRDRKRNFLFDHLGAGEDGGDKPPIIRPDCADLPYFLRAYFAFKQGLPFGIGECTRGGGGAPPACKGLITNEDPDTRADARRKDGAVATFGAFLRGTLADKAHSGSARAPFEDQSADYYPVPLSWEALRPGTVYADPYGHILVVAKRVPQSPDHAGILYAVDGQPDGTVARKRFWRGNFLYATQRELGGPGFKRFRPLARRGDHLLRLDDDAIRKSSEYGDLSRDAAKLDIEGFYDAMDDVLAPKPLDPESALMETLSALEEQVKTRVTSVDNGRRWLEKKQGPAPLPDGAEIFETTGAWEDFATPSRDLRLLIAIDVVRGFPARVARRPERYASPRGSRTPQEAQAALEAILDRELHARSITYTRSDGSPFPLDLAEVLARATALESAYNLNDCVETRWGAPAGSPEASTCRAHAPPEQRAQMETYRAWFHERRRPPRK